METRKDSAYCGRRDGHLHRRNEDARSRVSTSSEAGGIGARGAAGARRVRLGNLGRPPQLVAFARRQPDPNPDLDSITEPFL